MNKIEVIRGNITHLETDAIVNATNESLLGGGGFIQPFSQNCALSGPRASKNAAGKINSRDTLLRNCVIIKRVALSQG